MKIPRIRAVEPKTSTAEWTALPGGRGFSGKVQAQEPDPHEGEGHKESEDREPR
jgi:hypothetical protein